MRLNLSKSAASNVWWFVQPHKTNEKPSEPPPPVPDSCQSKNRHKSKYVQCLLCPWSVILFSWSVDSDWILTIIKQGEIVSTLGEQLGYGINNPRTYEKTPFCWMDSNCTIWEVERLGKNQPISYVRRPFHHHKPALRTLHNGRIYWMTSIVDCCWWSGK